ncbi:hypothetical protein BBP00_00000400 [Phytophthora kernoviae]|uniref:HTH CENPB-type domain-containing protein n=1 Tax=Phytophthora kernoviae TaxID=325452 RepID=A0A3F2S389_9STRA|nr:hypothetical protein BBP00_00000400 [Phytophthora kernoviae]
MPTAPQAPRPRTTFTNAQRLEICRHYSENPSLTQNQLAEWVQETFNLPRAPSQAMISKLLKRKEALEAASPAELGTKSRRHVRFPQVDAALARWVTWCEGRGVGLTGDEVKLKAASFARLLGVGATSTWSNGWLQKFYTRHGFRSFKGHGDSRVVVETMISDLQRKLQGYELRNIFCMDETGLLYSMPPEKKKIGQSRKRFTIAFSCNADGSERLPPLFVGKAENPRGFNMNTAIECNYTNSWKGLMTRAIFEDWIKGVDAKFRQQDRKCVLLLDNAAVHGCVDVNELTNIQLAFLPPNSTNFSTREYMEEGSVAETAVSDEITTMLHYLHTEDPMPVEELLSLPDEDVIEDEPTDQYFCGIEEPVGVEVDSTPDDDDGDLSVEDLKERLQWIGKLTIHADSTGMPASELSGLRVLQRHFHEELEKKQSRIGVITERR